MLLHVLPLESIRRVGVQFLLQIRIKTLFEACNQKLGPLSTTPHALHTIRLSRLNNTRDVVIF